MRKSSFLAILFILVLPLLCAAAEPVLQGLHIEGISNSVYVVQVLKQDDVTYSNVFRRNIGETYWQMISSIPGVVTGTTSYGNDLS